jgi:purine-binding chemotaxis protein CheW
MAELLLIVTIAGERVSLPGAEVESVVEIEGLVPVPRAPAHVAGLTALRSRVLTAIDSLASLDLGQGRRSGTHDAVVVEQDGLAYALLVDGVEDVIEYQGELRPVRTALQPGWARVARGLVETERGFLLLADPAALIAGPPALAAAS